MHRIEDRAFFARDARDVAKDLLGLLLVHRTGAGELILRITETEAYLGPEDLASHARGGRMTKRNRIMFGEAGHVYMFLIYGMYHCFNITAGEAGRPEAVLVRAGEAVAGTETMLSRRRLEGRAMSQQRRVREIASGPGKLAQALGLDLLHNGLDLLSQDPSPALFIARDSFSAGRADIEADVRIGIDYAGDYRDKPWRYYLKHSPTVSITRQQRERSGK